MLRFLQFCLLMRNGRGRTDDGGTEAVDSDPFGEDTRTCSANHSKDACEGLNLAGRTRAREEGRTVLGGAVERVVWERVKRAVGRRSAAIPGGEDGQRRSENERTHALLPVATNFPLHPSESFSCFRKYASAA